MATRFALGAAAAWLAVPFSLLVPACRTSVVPADEQPAARLRAAAPAVDATAAASTAGESGFLGVVFAQTTVDLAAEFDGRLERVDVRTGDRVRRGARLAALDARSLQQDLQIAEAGLRAADAEREQAALELADMRARLERLTRLADLVSAEQAATGRYQAARAAARVQQTEAQAAERRARVDQLRDTIAEADIRAPFDGVVAARYLDPGATVARGAPILRLISADTLRLRFAVPEARVAEVAPGQRVVARVDASALTLAGTIASIAPDIDHALQMFIAEATLAVEPSVRSRISAGAIARVFLTPSAESDSR